MHLNDAAGTGPGAAVTGQGVSPVDGDPHTAAPETPSAPPASLSAGVSPLWHSLLGARPAQHGLLVLVRHLRGENYSQLYRSE